MNRVIFQLIDAVKYCHDNLVILGLITVEDLRLVDCIAPKMKLSRYGLYEVGKGIVDHVIGSLWYLAPERLSALQNGKIFAASFKSDIWSIGIILLSLFTSKKLDEVWGAKQILPVMLNVIKQGKQTDLYQLSVFQQIVNQFYLFFSNEFKAKIKIWL